ncbi:MAG: helix-turn-helix transcriptional regulator [Paludibacteraceae bacterium]|nr:helix-turn-helix transcriptional regulator [Paludibacteraceae bacterium]
MAKNGHMETMSKWVHEYKSELVFMLVVTVIVGASTYLSQFIPDKWFDVVITPATNVSTFTVGFLGAWVIFRHSEGLLIRRLWGYALLAWAICDLAYLVCYLIAPLQVMNMGAAQLTTYELLLGNLLGWMLVLYPTETIRPGWLKPKTIAWQLLPIIALVALDYVAPFTLRPVIALYPFVLLFITLSHIRSYRIWCENNYSSMEHIDVQWIIRYCFMLILVAANYAYMCTGHGHNRAFTQQWFIVFMLGYSTEQILFRRNPWEMVHSTEDSSSETDVPEPDDAPTSDEAAMTNRQALEQWMEHDKPYLNPDFRLIDLQQVLPMNRTYLSQFIHTEYNCSFYQFVGHYRVEEAKRMMREHPDMKIATVATRCGFSSPVVFTRIFSAFTGKTPSEWN